MSSFGRSFSGSIWLIVLGLPLAAERPADRPKPKAALPVAKPAPSQKPARQKPAAPKRRERMQRRDDQIDRMLKGKQSRGR